MIGLIICHKSLAAELMHTARAIVGHHHDLYPFSNEKLTAQQLLEKIEAELEVAGRPEEAIVMVDLRGGSCWTAAKMLARSRPGFRILSGVNLPMLFSFLTKKEVLTSEELIENLEKDAHRGIFLE